MDRIHPYPDCLPSVEAFPSENAVLLRVLAAATTLDRTKLTHREQNQKRRDAGMNIQEWNEVQTGAMIHSLPTPSCSPNLYPIAGGFSLDW
jgi:hypothetical protein